MPSPSILEIVIIAVIAIVFVKPEDWPALLRKIGKWYGKIQRQIWDFKMASRQMMDEYSLKEELKHDHFESQYGQDIPEEENHENSYKHGQSVSRSGYVDTENLDDEDEYSDEGETYEEHVKRAEAEEAAIQAELETDAPHEIMAQLSKEAKQIPEDSNPNADSQK